MIWLVRTLSVVILEISFNKKGSFGDCSKLCEIIIVLSTFKYFLSKIWIGNKNILVLCLLRKYFARYFKNYFAIIYSFIQLPLPVQKKRTGTNKPSSDQILILQDLKTFWISLLHRISNIKLYEFQN